MVDKIQPWKAAHEAAAAAAPATEPAGVDYGVPKGAIAVVDGTAANVKPAAPLRLDDGVGKAQPWKASWPGAAAAAPANAAAAAAEYGVPKGDTVVVDGTAANVKPRTKQTVRAERE